ncbi:cyclopentanone 1,2-monooxygenase [Xylariaceae sp. FL0016]|nr:cyclopentanone 1,2-monooxygenase [Xylariaceae sp. FL0016]
MVSFTNVKFENLGALVIVAGFSGARTDGHAPHYQFSDRDLWRNWHGRQRFPDHIRAYSEFVADRWNLRDDTYCTTRITSAQWDDEQGRWIIKASNGYVFGAQFFLPHTGIAAKTSLPSLDLRNKKVVLVQSLGPVVGELLVVQRTPIDGEGPIPKPDLPQFFRSPTDRHFALDFKVITHGTFDDSQQQRPANHEAHKFWRERTLTRIYDDEMRRMLAPKSQPHAFGFKRVPLEIGYSEVFNQRNVHLVDINWTPVLEVTRDGLRTVEKKWNLDVTILTTGFHVMTGGWASIDIRGIRDRNLCEKWQELQCPSTYLGISVSDSPNVFFSYGPQSPAAFCNGPTCAVLQAAWSRETSDIAKATLVYETRSTGILQRANAFWYMGDDIPDKPRAPLQYFGGVAAYKRRLEECAAYEV